MGGEAFYFCHVLVVVVEEDAESGGLVFGFDGVDLEHLGRGGHDGEDADEDIVRREAGVFGGEGGAGDPGEVAGEFAEEEGVAFGVAAGEIGGGVDDNENEFALFGFEGRAREDDVDGVEIAEAHGEFLIQGLRGLRPEDAWGRSGVVGGGH